MSKRKKQNQSGWPPKKKKIRPPKMITTAQAGYGYPDAKPCPPDRSPYRLRLRRWNLTNAICLRHICLIQFFKSSSQDGLITKLSSFSPDSKT